MCRTKRIHHLQLATSVNGTTIWDDDQYVAPISFPFSINGSTSSNFYIDLENGGFVADIASVTNGFAYGDMDLADRGNLTSAATLSPIRYLVSGTTPNRIFKFEIANAGFYDEINDNGTSNDFVNIQIWLYETSNIVELRYGPSAVSTTDYFFLGNGPAVGYIDSVNVVSGDIKIFYTLAGNPSTPTIDSIDFNTGSGNVLNSYPPNGTVYRFTPKTSGPSGVGSIPGFADLQVYPTMTSSFLNVSYNDKTSANYEVIAIDGRKTGISGRLNNGKNSLDVSALANGMYLMRVENSTNRSVYRFTKK